jgi:hypothetical protein
MKEGESRPQCRLGIVREGEQAKGHVPGAGRLKSRLRFVSGAL